MFILSDLAPKRIGHLNSLLLCQVMVREKFNQLLQSGLDTKLQKWLFQGSRALRLARAVLMAVRVSVSLYLDPTLTLAYFQSENSLLKVLFTPNVDHVF